MKRQQVATMAGELLQPYRLRLDSINMQLLGLLAERMCVCMDIARVKAAENIPMMQPARVSHVLDTVREHSFDLGLSPNYTLTLFSLIIEETCRQETALIENLRVQGCAQ